MEFFSQSQKSYLNIKFEERRAFANRIDYLRALEDMQQLTPDGAKELFFMVLATRLLRAKFFSVPALTNEELAYLTGCPSGTYLGLIMSRTKDCSPDLALMMSAKLKELEMMEGMQPIIQPSFPGKN